MNEVRLRARTVSEIVDAAFALYRRDASQYTLLMAIAITPQLVTQIVLRPGGVTLGFSGAMIALASSLVSIFTYTVGTAAIMKFGAAVYLGDAAELDASVRSVIPKLWTILWAGFLKGLLYFLGFLFFFVGEFYVAARWFGVTAAIVLEDASTGEAFSRSTALSSGRKRHILNTLLLVWIIYILLTACILAVAAIAKSTVITLVLGTAFQVVAYPIVGLTSMLLYYDCRIRSEGFDIEQMAASIGFEPGSAQGAAGAAP
jgi:hypothetical protein